MTTVYPVDTLVDDTLQHLLGTASEELNLLGALLSASATDAVGTVSLTYGVGGAVPGVYLSIEDETMYVLSVNDAANTVDVLRGQKDSAPVAHALNAIVHVDPPWPRFVVMQALRDEIRSWGPQVYRLATKSITITTNIVGYDLGDSGPIYGLKGVYRDPPPYIGGFGFTWQAEGVPTDESWPMVPAEIRQVQPTSDFPSGNALILKTNTLTAPTTIWVVYSKPFDVDTSWSDTTDIIGDVGLDTSDLDIPGYGAAWRLLAFRAPRRLFTQIAGQPADDQAVPPLSLMQLADQFKQTRDGRLGDAEERLFRMFPLEINVS